MPDAQLMREEIKKVYSSSKSWAKKVDKMSDGQVFRIYTDFVNKGKI